MLTRGMLFVSILLLGYGVAMNLRNGVERTALLHEGEQRGMATLVAGKDSLQTAIDPNVRVSLDTLILEPHTPEYELQLWERDTSKSGHLGESVRAVGKLVSSCALKPMKIEKVPGSDFRFRLAEFYPDFDFTYVYPENPDTIPPRAPGITLKLKTDEGDAIVTLRSDSLGKNKLDDVVGLGKSLEFYWEIPGDTLSRRVSKSQQDTGYVVFSGKEQKVYEISSGKINTLDIAKDTFYALAGGGKYGFNILQCFPDIAYMKAVPSTRSEELKNPVARIQIWRLGEGYQEVYLYPESYVRSGGDFAFPGTPVTLLLGLAAKRELRYCTGQVSFTNDLNGTLETQSLSQKKMAKYGGYSLQLCGCRGGGFQEARIQFVRAPGRPYTIIGAILGLVGAILLFAGNAKETYND